jgi:hypothetical protein
MLSHLSAPESKAVLKYREQMCARTGRDVPLEEALSDWLQHHAMKWRIERQAHMLSLQREEILRHKWIESEKAHRDLGAEAMLDWIDKYAAHWRDWYERNYEPFEMSRASNS